MASETETSYIYEVQLRFDTDLRSKLVNLYNLTTRSTQSDYEPHIKLLVAKVPFQIQNLPASVPVESMFRIAFPGYGVQNRRRFFFGVTPTLGLFRFHRNVCDALTRDYPTNTGLEILEEYRPGRWSPRFTLVEPLVDDDHVRHARRVMSQNRSPRIGAVKSFGFVQLAAFPVPGIGSSGKLEASSEVQGQGPE